MAYDDVNRFLQDYGYFAMQPNAELQAAFFEDLDPGDIAEFESTAHTRSWQEGLAMSFQHSTDTYVVASPNHSGTAIWGTTRIHDRIARIWLLQTQTFAREAAAFLGPAYPHKMAGLARGAIAHAMQEYDLVFNFIPRRRKRNIRFLKIAGFEFFSDPFTGSDWLFFGVGQNIRLLAHDRTLWLSALGKADR